MRELILLKINQLEKTVEELKKEVDNLKGEDEKQINKDGIPVESEIFAEIDNIGKVILKVKRKSYQVKNINGQEITEGKHFNSLSAAAEQFSNIKKKSGWIFWYDSKSGKTLKEVYKG